MQALDGNFDPSHVQFLHSTVDNSKSHYSNRFRGGERVSQDSNLQSFADFVETDYGLMFLYVNDRADGRKGVSLGHFYMPNASAAGIAGFGVYSSNIYIPIDDENLYAQLQKLSTITQHNADAREMPNNYSPVTERSAKPKGP